MIALLIKHAYEYKTGNEKIFYGTVVDMSRCSIARMQLYGYYFK